MMRKMNLEKRTKKGGIIDSSDSESSDNDENKPMEVEMTVSKQIRKKPLPRTYY